MSDRSSPQSAPSASAGQMPGEVARGLISLWIIIHFAGILLAVFTLNELSRGQGEMGRSLLLTNLKTVPPIYQYTNALWFDVPYDFHLANEDFSLRMELMLKDGRTETVTIPTSDIALGENRERLARMASSIASAFEMGNSKTAAMIGKAILTQYDADELKLLVVRHQPLSIDDAQSSDAAQRDPSHRRTYLTAFEATISLDVAGNAQVSMKQEALDVAPVNRGGASTKAPDASKRRKTADPLPPAEVPKNLAPPKSLIRPTEPAADPTKPTK